MKNLYLILAILFTTSLCSQSDYDGFIGSWESEETKYTLIISKHFAKDHFKFLNYKLITQTLYNGEQKIITDYSPEEFVKSEGGKLHTFIAWEFPEKGMKDYYCDVVYEFVDENNLKATFSGSNETVLYYTKIQ